MKLNENNLKIAIQKSGRLTEPTIELLQRSGFEFEAYGRQLFATCRNFPLEFLFLRDDDIPEYVQDGVCALGIVGSNVIEEKGAQVKRLERLGFGKCRLSLAVPVAEKVKDLTWLKGKMIATTYPKILRRFLEETGISASILEVNGSVEIAPTLAMAEAICDLVSTGTTLRMNGLCVLETIMESEAELIGCPSLLNESKNKLIVERFLMRIRGVLVARRNKYVMMNAPATALDDIRAVLPGLKSPTVVPLADSDMIAVHSVVPEDRFWEVIERLKQVGASGILVLPIEKMIL